MVMVECRVDRMSGCDCETLGPELARDERRRRTLRIVLAINAVAFVVVLGVGLWAESQALIADSADNLGDALVYALSLAVVARSMRWRAGAAVVKGIVQLAFGLFVAASIANSFVTQPEPLGAAMMSMAAVALVGNLVCFTLLLKHRGEDVNMRSVWLCSRNDVIANAGVIVAGVLVVWLNSHWPDTVVASLIAAVFLHTAFVVLRDATLAWRTTTGVAEP